VQLQLVLALLQLELVQVLVLEQLKEPLADIQKQ